MVASRLNSTSRKYLNDRLLLCACEGSHDSRLNSGGPHADSLYQVPRKEAVDQEFGLFTFLDPLFSEVVRCHCLPVDLAELVDLVAKFGIASSGVREAESPSVASSLSPGDDVCELGFQVDDGILATAVG